MQPSRHHTFLILLFFFIVLKKCPTIGKTCKKYVSLKIALKEEYREEIIYM